MPGAGPVTHSVRIPPVWQWALLYGVALFYIAPVPDIPRLDDYGHIGVALQMVHGGDWLVPRVPGGGTGLHGPAAGYWPLAASLAPGGAWAARLPSVLAGALTVGLIGALGARLAGRRAGRLAAMLCAASLPWLAAGFRIGPDPWLALLATLSAGGFLLRLNAAGGRGALWAGWVGLGLAAAVAGAAAWLLLLPVAAASLVVTRDAWRRLLHWPAVAAGLALGLAWYAAVAVQLVPEALAGHWRASLPALPAPGQAARQALGWLAFAPLALLPWSLLAGGLHRDDWREALAHRHARVVAAFTASATLLYGAACALAGPWDGARLLGPLAPWLALFLALGLEAGLPRGRPSRARRGAVIVALALAALAVGLGANALAAALGLLAEDQGAGARILVVSAALGAAVLGPRLAPDRALALIALLVIGCVPLIRALAGPLVPDPARDMARALERAGWPAPVVVADAPPPAGLTALLADRRVRFSDRPASPPAEFGALVIPETRLSGDDYPDCTRQRVATDHRGLDPAALAAALRAGEGRAYRERHERVWVMVRCAREPGG